MSSNKFNQKTANGNKFGANFGSKKSDENKNNLNGSKFGFGKKKPEKDDKNESSSKDTKDEESNSAVGSVDNPKNTEETDNSAEAEKNGDDDKPEEAGNPEEDNKPEEADKLENNGKAASGPKTSFSKMNFNNKTKIGAKPEGNGSADADGKADDAAGEQKKINIFGNKKTADPNEIIPELENKKIINILEDFEKEMNEQIEIFQLRAILVTRCDRSIYDCLDLLLHLDDQIQTIESSQRKLINDAKKIISDQEAFLKQLNDGGKEKDKPSSSTPEKKSIFGKSSTLGKGALGKGLGKGALGKGTVGKGTTFGKGISGNSSFLKKKEEPEPTPEQSEEPEKPAGTETEKSESTGKEEAESAEKKKSETPSNTKKTIHFDKNNQRYKLYEKASKLGKKLNDMSEELKSIKEQTDRFHQTHKPKEDDIDRIKKIANCHLNAMRYVDKQADELEKRLDDLLYQLHYE